MSINELNNIVTIIVNKIKCLLSDGINTVITGHTLTCQTPLPVVICTDTPKIDPEVVCLSNDGGITVLKGWEVFDISTNPPTSKLYIGGAEVTGYQVVPCDKQVKYDYEKDNVCVDGNTWTKWYVLDKIDDGLPNVVSIFWLDQNDDPQPSPDPLLINNINCNVCSPSRESFYGDNATLTEFNDIHVDIPPCCEVTIETSDGIITIPAKNTNWIYTERWDCFVSGYKVSSTCDVNNIFTIIKKTK